MKLIPKNKFGNKILFGRTGIKNDYKGAKRKVETTPEGTRITTLTTSTLGFPTHRFIEYITPGENPDTAYWNIKEDYWPFIKGSQQMGFSDGNRVEFEKRKKEWQDANSVAVDKNGSKIKKAEGGIKTDADIYGRMVPFYGTYLEGRDFVKNPSWPLAGWTVLSALGDASMLIPLIGPEIKAATSAARTANALGKATKLSRAERIVPLVQEAGKAASKAAVKVADDVTWPALYTFMARPSGVVLSLPFREPEKSNTKSSNNSNWFVQNQWQDSGKNDKEDNLESYKKGSKIRKGQNDLDTDDLYINDSLFDILLNDRENVYHDQMAKEYANKEEWYYRPLQWWHEAQGSNGWFRNIIPNAVTGIAPSDFTPLGSGASKLTKAQKLASAARKEDKAIGVTKKVKTQVKQGQGFDSGDARHVTSGQSKVTNSQLRRVSERVKNYPSESREYDRLLKKLAKATNPEDIKRIKREIRAYEKAFIEKYGNG